MSIVRRQDKSDHWRQVQYVIFDAPRVDDVFEDRLRLLQQLLAKRDDHVRLLEQQVCRNATHLGEELARIEALGGEGLMLRQPGSRYEAGRSSTLLKVKTFHDAEARVIDHQAGKGRHKGRLGALVVELADGTRFSVGTGFSDAQRESPPPIGSQITFRYQELSDGGVPRFPSFVRAADAASGTLETPNAAEPAGVKKRSSGRQKKPAAKAKPVAKAVAEAKPSKTKKSSPKASQPAASGVRYFEFSDDKSQKFWEIDLAGCDVTVR